MDFDFSEDFAKGAVGHLSPLQKLRQEWSSRRRRSSALGSPASEPRPQELFPSPQRPHQPEPVVQDHCEQTVPPSPLNTAEPREDAFVAANASVRRMEYEKLETWIAAGGSVEDFAPWFREMLMDQDDAAWLSALRAVAAHYRRQAQQGALAALGEHMAPVPICWLSVLAERLMRCDEGPATQEVAALVAACLAAFQQRSSDLSRHQAFLDRFAALPKGKVHLLAACEGVLQAEDWQEMWRVVLSLPQELLPRDAWQKLPVGLRAMAREEPSEASACGFAANDFTSSPVRSPVPALDKTPKTWRQRVRCLEQLTPGGDVQNLWPQLVLQAEDDHPAVSAAALQCLVRLAPQMPSPADHLIIRLASVLRHRLREPRCRPRRAALELLQSLARWNSSAAAGVLSQTLGISKERARKALLEMAERSSTNCGETSGPLEALLLEAFPRTGAPGTPGTLKTGPGLPSPSVEKRRPRPSPQKPSPSSPAATSTPATAAPGSAGLTSPPTATPETEEQPPSTPRKVLELEPMRGSGPLTPLPSNSTLLSFEATPQKLKLASPEDLTVLPTLEDEDHEASSDSGDDHGQDECHGDGSGEEVVAAVDANSSRRSPVENEASDHGELAWSFHKIHMITLDFSRPGVDEVDLWQKLSQLLSRSAFQGPLRRFLERWRQRQRRRAAAKENLPPGKSPTRLDDYASLRELCSDEDLPGAFPQSVLSHLRRTLTTKRPVRVAVVQAAVQALEKCAMACGPAFHPAWRRFAAPLLRLSAARRALRRGSAGALLRGTVELRHAWRTWMQVCHTSGVDQALLAESLQLVAMLDELPRFEIPREVLQDILVVACPHLEAERGSRVAVAAQRCLQSFRNLLGGERLKEEVAEVAPKLNWDVLEPEPPATSEPPRRCRRRNSRDNTETVGPEQARLTTIPVEATASARDVAAVETAAPGGFATLGELEIFEAKLLDLPALRNLSSPGELRRMWQDLAARFAPKQMARLLLAAATSVRLCLEAAAEEAMAISSLKAAHEVLLALQTCGCAELPQLLAAEAADLFHDLLQILLQLEILSASEVFRQWTKPILLEVPPFFARAMDLIQAEQQLIAWLELASKLLGQGWRGGRPPSAAKKIWALRFCARGAERCIGAWEGDEHLAWEALTKVAQIRQSGRDEFADPGSEWPGILQALCGKICELYPCQARDFLELTGALDGPVRRDESRA